MSEAKHGWIISMPIPMWVAKVNRRFFNPMEIKKGERPIIIHDGRSSGETYRTPLDAHPVEGGYVFFLMYGSGSDWVQNILASGSAALSIEGDEIELVSPRLIPGDVAWQILSADVKKPAGFLKVAEYLQMDRPDID